MNNEFKKLSQGDVTRYVLENASGGGTSSGSVASVSMPMGGMQRRKGDNLIAQESDKKKVPASTPRNFVAKNAKSSGAGAHKDKKKEAKQGNVKHKKPFMENFNGEYDDEAGMAQSNLLTTARAVMGLLKTIKDRDNLPEWGQEKIAKAEMMLVSVWDYLQSQKAMGNDPQQGMEEDDSALNAFLSKGGKVQQLPYKKPRKADKTDYGSKHIGGGGDKMKASRTGTAAKTQGSKVVGVAEGDGNPDIRPGMKVSQGTVVKVDGNTVTVKRSNGDMMTMNIHDIDQAVAEGWDDIKKFGKKAAVAGAIGLGIGAANAGGFPSDVPAGGHNQLPDIVAHVKFKVGDKVIDKEINLGSHYRSPGEAGEELKNFLNSKGIKFYEYSLERVKPKADNKIDNSPAVGTGNEKPSIDTKEPASNGKNTGDYMAKEDADTYFESLQTMMERQLEPTMDLDAWVDNFQNADPQKYHQFKNKTPEKKK